MSPTATTVALPPVPGSGGGGPEGGVGGGVVGGVVGGVSGAVGGGTVACGLTALWVGAVGVPPHAAASAKATQADNVAAEEARTTNITPECVS
jgi:hypothetical protein